MKKYFGQIDMSWKRTVLFSLVVAFYTGLINCVPFLDNTSFKDIAITYEWWVVFALIVVTNVKRPLEAAAKCFVFFLVSQPVIFLVEVLVGKITLQDAIRFYKQMWLFMTILTFPGGFIAWFVKKDNILGALILSLGNTIILTMGVHFLKEAMLHFPYHLLSAIFCTVSSIALPCFIFEKKKIRIFAIVLSYLLVGILIGCAQAKGLSI